MSVRERNSFTRKMEQKSTEELHHIIGSKDYALGAKQAAQWELTARKEDGTLDLENEKRMNFQLGESRYDLFVNTIKKKRVYKFFGTPSYAESLDNDLSINTKTGLILKTLEKLKWQIVYKSENIIQALRPDLNDRHSEQIMICFGEVNILVKSISLGSASMDGGDNSIRVKLFFHVFEETLNQLGEEQLAELEEEIRKDKNWENYQEPVSLPNPPQIKREQVILLFLGTLITSIILGILLGLGMSTFYLVFLFEIGISWVLGMAMAEITIFTNTFNHKSPKYLLIAATAIIIIAAQFTGYYEFLSQDPILNSYSFFDYMELKIQAGFTLEDINLGSWGWLGVFILQSMVIYYHGMLRLFNRVSDFVLKRIPEEVIEYICFLDFKEYEELEIRKHLAIKGWKDEEVQDAAFQAIGSLSDKREAIKKV